jgi:hypothetical protein
LPEDEQTSKHGGGGRYNATLEFKGVQIKNFDEKSKKKKNKKENERIYIYIYMRKKRKI